MALQPVHWLVAATVCLAISASLITRLWTVHSSVSVRRKIFWSIALLVPLVGWIFYAGFFAPPAATADSPGTENWWGPP